MSAYDIVQTCGFHQGSGGRRLGSTGSAIFAILSICITKQRKTAAEQRAVSLFFTSPNHRQPRISAENEMSIADNLWAKQQKQREPSRGRPFCASDECV